MGTTSSYDNPVLKSIILKGANVMGEYTMPNPPQGLADKVIQVTQEAQREALLMPWQEWAPQAEPERIEADAITQLEADDRFDEQVYTVGELLDRVGILMEDVDCAESLLGAEVPMTKSLRGAVKAFRGRQLAELRRLKAGRVVV